jgi:hypothetical protein
MVSSKVERKEAKEKQDVVQPPSNSSDKVAIHSTKNVHWAGLGALRKGYNIVSPGAAQRWLSKDFTREATEEEISREYGL